MSDFHKLGHILQLSYITYSEVEHFATTRIASETKFRACTYNTVIVISRILTAELLFLSSALLLLQEVIHASN